MTVAILLHLYGSVAALLLPVAACAGVGAYWGFNKLVYPGDFVSVPATKVATPALVFHTLLTTRLDDAQLLQVFGAVAGLVVASTMGLPALVASVLQLQFLMPVAVTNYRYAERFTTYGHLSAGAVLVSTSVFLLLSPLLL